MRAWVKRLIALLFVESPTARGLVLVRTSEDKLDDFIWVQKQARSER